MITFASPLAEGRLFKAVLVTLTYVCHAIALGFGAFATRDAFASLHGSQSVADKTIMMLGLSGLAAGATIIVGRRLSEELGQAYVIRLRELVYTHIAGMSRSDLAKRRLGGLSLRFVGDMSAAKNWTGKGIGSVISAAVVLPVAGFVLWWLHPVMASIAGAAGLGMLVVSVIVAITLPAAHKKLRGKRASVAINAIERIARAPELDLAGRTPKEVETLSESGERLAEFAVQRQTAIAMLSVFPQIAASIAGASILWVAGPTGIGAAEVAAGLALLGILALPLGELANAYNYLCAWHIARNKLNALFATPSRPRVVGSAGEQVGVVVTMTRNDGAVEEVSLSAGEISSMHTPSDFDDCKILQLIAGIEREVPNAEVRYVPEVASEPRIAYIDRTPLILQGSLRRALTLGAPKRPSAKKVSNLARKFGLRETLERIGYLGRVDAGARNLTRDEKLGIELVRAILSKPDLIVLNTPDIWLAKNPDQLLADLKKHSGATIVTLRAKTIANNVMREAA